MSSRLVEMGLKLAPKKSPQMCPVSVTKKSALVAREVKRPGPWGGRRARCQETDDPHDPTVY
jgi:hypothetical protein